MHLIPYPKKIICGDGFYELRNTHGGCDIYTVSSGTAVECAIEKLQEALTGKGIRVVKQSTNCGRKDINVSSVSEVSSSENYRLIIEKDGVTVEGDGPAGVFWGTQTLLQLIKHYGTRLPFLKIEDAPDFRHRGFLHDVTRGKVPKLETLMHLVDKLAYYKINQLQIYIEHSFAFKNIPELWEGRDPLTADEIRALDAYCRRNCVDLVPSLATFGHLYELLRLKRFEHLNELNIKASELPHNLWNRMAHYTIDVTNDESIPLIKGMIDEFVPLFSSQYCNICCDETFDLGKGKNKISAEKNGVGNLYAGFVKKLMNAVREHGKCPMIWGDVVLRYPELIGELPEDTVFLNWGYGADVTDTGAKIFAGAGAKQYVCPGVQGWSRFVYDNTTASANIRKMVGFGVENGALGVLNTDWGDCGHVNFLAGSYHGMAFGAALSWNASSYHENAHFDAAVSALEFGDLSGTIATHLRELGSLCSYHFGNMYAWVNGIPGAWDKEQEVKEADPEDIARNHLRATEIINILQALKDSKNFKVQQQDYDELVWGAVAVRWVLGLLVFKKANEFHQPGCRNIYENKLKLLKDGKALLKEFERLWRQRNKESELRNVIETFRKIFVRVEELPDE